MDNKFPWPLDKSIEEIDREWNSYHQPWITSYLLTRLKLTEKKLDLHQEALKEILTLLNKQDDLNKVEDQMWVIANKLVGNL